MDFITDLPKSKSGNTAILTCIDAATRRGRSIPCKLAGLTAEKTAKLIRKNLIRQHGIPKVFITDRGQQYINKFWKQIGTLMGFQNIPTTTAYQQGNGLAERIHHRGNISEHLCEFSWDNSKHAVTGLTPFYADQGYLPNSQIVNEEPGEPITCESAAIHAQKLIDTKTKFKTTMVNENKKMKHYYDRKRIEMDIQVGDWVILRTTHIKTKRPCKKLAEKQIDPFKVPRKVTDLTYQLNLKNLKGKIHVFHVEKLEKATLPQLNQQECERTLR
ncbi:hypothetical protein K3495_g6571 [Podosphaera aphanis]|nr:hypothetical protein K3495_g6571 [Podosphaera aphanis]